MYFMNYSRGNGISDLSQQTLDPARSEPDFVPKLM